jgi:hypothetical protein
MNRGDRREAISEDDDDRERFLTTLVSPPGYAMIPLRLHRQNLFARFDHPEELTVTVHRVDAFWTRWVRTKCFHNQC